MNVNTDTTATTDAATETRDVGDAIDLLCRAISLNELIFMAGEGMAIHSMRDAITVGADAVEDVLKEVKTILYANIGQKGGAA